MQTLKYEVGSRFPFDGPTPNQDHCNAIIAGSSFDVAYYIAGGTNSDRRVFKDSLVRLHILACNDIPFIAVSFLGSKWTFDFTITAPRDPDSPFYERGNAVVMCLVDAKTNILQVGRLLGLPEDAEMLIKDACKKQIEQYSDEHAVNRAVANIQHDVSTEYIIKHGAMFEFKRSY